MDEIVILSGARSAIGTFGGSLSGLPLSQVATTVTRAALERAGVEPGQVGTVVFGHVINTEPRDAYLSRVAAMGAGIPDTVPAMNVNRLCGSGAQAIVSAVQALALGDCDYALAAGAEAMSRAPYILPAARWGQKMGDVGAQDMMLGALTCPFGTGHMGVTAENVAAENQISRADQDGFALESQTRAARAIAEGRFASQIVPIMVKTRKGEVAFEVDEHPKATTAEALAGLRPAFRKDGSVTAGNASGINDGAAALVLMDAARASATGAPIMGRIVATGLGGVAPDVMGLGPVPATRQALHRAGLAVGDLDVIESNEAFAAQASAVTTRLGLDPARVNPNGGAVALGHPIGASGAIILVKLVHELHRSGGRYGLATMCIGGGQGIAVIIERG